MELRAGLGRWSYQTFLDALDQGFGVVHPDTALIEAASEGGFGEIFQGHYNEKGNRIVAEELFKRMTR